MSSTWFQRWLLLNPSLASTHQVGLVYFPLPSLLRFLDAYWTRMPSSSVALQLPFFPSPHFRLKSSPPTLFIRLPSSKLVFFGRFLSNILVSERKWILGPSAFRCPVGDEGAGMIQSDPLSHGPSRFELFISQFETILNKLSKWLVAGLFCLIILLKHDAEALWAVIGSVINSALSIVLKRVLNQERPILTLRSDPGMPSSHAQSISFIALFVILSIVEWGGVCALSLSLSGVVILMASYLTWLRVSQQLHTISQVAVGAAVGSVFSVLWFWFWKALVSKAFVSHLWVRIVVITGASGFCLGFVVYAIKNWFRRER